MRGCDTSRVLEREICETHVAGARSVEVRALGLTDVFELANCFAII